MRRAVWLFAAVVWAGCATRGEVATLSAEVKALREEQGKLAERVAALEKSKPSAAGSLDTSKVYPVPVADAPSRGPADAWVTIVEFSDFQCPFCSKAASTVDELLRLYPDEVRLVFRNLPLSFHTNAAPAAHAAMCAHAQGLFWPMHDLLFANQRALTDNDLVGYAEQVPQLDLGLWRACFADPRMRAKVDADTKLAASLSPRMGTPTFFINGRVFTGAQPLEAFKARVDEELKRARASGIDRAQYYEKAVLRR